MKAISILALLAASMLVGQAQTLTTETQSPKSTRLSEDGPNERVEFSGAVAELWRSGDFESLERMSNQLRTKKLKSSDGFWKLSAFYQGIGIIGSGDAGYLAAERQVKAWLVKYPDSITAPIVEGRILTSHGWFFRGDGYADTITADGQAKFSNYLAEAREVLDKSSARCSVCPEWYNAMLTVGMGQGWEKAEFDRIFEQGVKLAPDYYELYFTRAVTLLPRWYGRDGDWQTFAEAQAAAHGDEVYARIAWSLAGYYPGKLFTEGRVSWSKMKAGFEAMLKDYPDSNWNLNAFCNFACLYGDRVTASQLFDRIGPNRHAVLWTETDFNQWKKWAAKSE